MLNFTDSHRKLCSLYLFLCIFLWWWQWWWLQITPPFITIHPYIFTLLSDLESLLTAQYNCLQHLMRAYMSLEVRWVPHLPHQLPKSLRQEAHDIPGGQLDTTIVAFIKEIITQWCDMSQSLWYNYTGVYIRQIKIVNKMGLIVSLR